MEKDIEETNLKNKNNSDFNINSLEDLNQNDSNIVNNDNLFRYFNLDNSIKDLNNNINFLQNMYQKDHENNDLENKNEFEVENRQSKVPFEAVININQNDYYYDNKNSNNEYSDLNKNLNNYDTESINLLLQEMIGDIQANIELLIETKNSIMSSINFNLFTGIKLILSNVLKNPGDFKYRELKFDNKKVNLMFSIPGVKEFLNVMGFEEIVIDIYSSNSNLSKSLILLWETDESKEVFKTVISMLDILGDNDNKNKEVNEQQKDKVVNINKFTSKKKNNNTNNIKDILKETAMIRCGEVIPSNDSNKNNAKSSNINLNLNPIVESNQNQPQQIQGKKSLKQANTNIKEILKETSHIRTQYQQSLNRGQIHTIENLPQNNYNSGVSSLNNKEFVNLNKTSQSRGEVKKDTSIENYKYTNQVLSEDNMSDRLDYIGKEALKLTNIFRKKHGLNELVWCGEIWKISIGHSKNMALGKVPFSHQGFNKRINSLPYSYQQANENVFMCTGYDERLISEMAVQGWIDSPGHRRNLLSLTNYCAIATYKSGYNTYHLTQIFIRR